MSGLACVTAAAAALGLFTAAPARTSHKPLHTPAAHTADLAAAPDTSPLHHHPHLCRYPPPPPKKNTYTHAVYELKGVGLDGKEKLFQKPWAMTTTMFVGE